MIRTLRALFLARLFREKLLLVAFAALGVLVWASGFNRRAGLFWREQRATSVSLAEQKLFLDNRDKIELAAQKTAARLDAAQTLDGTRLYAEVENLARTAGLTAGLSTQPDENSDQFAVHSIQVSITKAEWEPLMKFYHALQARSPYIGVEQFRLQVDRANPEKYHLATLRVSAPEIVTAR